jgi:hypothetical protein
MEVIYLSPVRGRRPKPAPVHWLAEDEDWTNAPELGFLARVAEARHKPSLLLRSLVELELEFEARR